MLWLEDTAVDRHHIHVISDTATLLMPIYLCIFLYWYKYPLTFGRNYGVWSVTWSVKCLEKSVLNRARGTDLHSVKQLLMLLASVHPNSEAQGCISSSLPLRSQILTTMQESHSTLENIVAHSSWQKRHTLLEVQLLHSKTKAFGTKRSLHGNQGPILNKWIKNHPESWC